MGRMPEGTTQASTVDDATKFTQSVEGVQPHGRSLDDFRDQETGSRLLPGEEALLKAVSKGDLCDLGGLSYKLQTELRKALSDPNVIKLAAELVASPAQTLQSQTGEIKDKREALEKLETQVRAQPRISREFLTELSRFSKIHTRVSNDLKARVMTEPELLRPILNELEEQFRSELRHWRQVDPADPTLRVRAAFLRFLALGGDKAAPVHERGVRLKHAFIDGEFDLTACTDVRPLELVNCFFSKSVNFSGAHLRRLNLSGCHVPSIDGVRCKTQNSVFLGAGFISLGSVRLLGAVIGGVLDCSGGRFDAGLNGANGKIASDVYLSSGFGAKGEVLFDRAEIGGDLDCSDGTFQNRTQDGQADALSCSGAKIDRNIYFSSKFSSEGKVSAYGTEVGGGLNCSGGTFRNRTRDGEGVALDFQRIKVGGTVFLTEGFTAEGCVTFIGAQIGGFLGCRGGTFDNLVPIKMPAVKHEKHETARAGMALDISNANIGDGLWLGANSDRSIVAAKIKGTLDLSGARARLLVDNSDSWPERMIAGQDGKKLLCTIAIDGFIYDRLAEGAPTDAARRKRWLSLQPPEHLRDDFRPQPFEQLIKVLREMGHEGDAQQIAIAKLRIRRRSKLVVICRDVVGQYQQNEWRFKPLKIFTLMFAAIGLFFEWLILDLLLGSGYAKVRPVLLFVIMLFGCAWFYDRAAEQSAFVPTNPVIYNDPEVRKACAGTKDTLDIAAPIDWYRCKKAPYELNPFRPLVYSVDQMIPFLQLGQKREWQPVSRQLRFDLWGIAHVSLPASTTLAVTWCQSIGSTMLYLLIAAILSGLIKRE